METNKNKTILQHKNTILGSYRISNDANINQKAVVNQEISKVLNKREVIIFGHLNSISGRKASGDVIVNVNDEKLEQLCKLQQKSLTDPLNTKKYINTHGHNKLKIT